MEVKDLVSKLQSFIDDINNMPEYVKSGDIDETLDEIRYSLSLMRGVKKTKEQNFVNDWNMIDGNIPNVRTPISSTRRTKVRVMFKENTKADIYLAIKKMGKSNFCQGVNDRGWTANFDWFIRKGTVDKILEGLYDNKDPVSNKTKNLVSQRQRMLDR